MPGHIGFDLRVDIGEGSHSPGNRASRDLSAGGNQAVFAAVEFGVCLRELETECHGFGVNTVAAADSGRIFVLYGAGLESGQKRVEIGQEDIRGPCKLHRKRRVEHIRGRHSLMHETRFLTNLLSDPSQEGDNVMFGHRFDSVDSFHIDCGLACPPVPQRSGR